MTKRSTSSNIRRRAILDYCKRRRLTAAEKAKYVREYKRLAKEKGYV